MKLRLVGFTLLGVLLAGAIAAPLVNSECELCGGDGKLECAACKGIGAAPHFIIVECHCNFDPHCPLCYGQGYYVQLTAKPCEECDGKGWVPCAACHGDGKRNLIERIPDLWREKLKKQE